ncbi:Putative gustatory receptor 28b [Cyphomyrmex costatus]|uniref:Gustatory receptor n=1 Tax=Cyphomyrmex costatus TaxID=456900 RepID=A0A195CST4_9HYME|nr:Putative gustatory receptor 28b [Cyphomyrmex costatus]
MFDLSSNYEGRRKGKIWQLFRATNFQSLMYPCFTFCRILGIFPYKINDFTIETYKPYYFLSIIVIFIYCIYELKLFYNINFTNNDIYKNIPIKLERNFFYSLNGITTITTFILCGSRMRLLQNIIKISLRLPQESYQNLSKLIHVKDIFGFFYIVVQMLIFGYKLQWDISYCIFSIYIHLVVFQMDMLYMNCVCILKACFKQINDSLVYLRTLTTNNEPCSLSRMYHKQRNPLPLMQLKALMKQHLVISDTVQMMTMIFSLQFLSTIIVAFIEITFNLYYYLIRIQTNIFMSDRVNQVYDEVFMTAVMYDIIKIMLVVWACETGKNQILEINTTVYDVYNSTNNKDIKYELKLFSLQLMHRKNIFSTKMFIVDATLLTAMVSGITTYLLILIQFYFVSNSCNRKTNFTNIDIY